MSKKSVFLQQVTGLIKSKEAKKAVALELERHMEASTQAMIESGLSPEEAENKAVKQMGDPIMLGVKMGKLHRPKMDWGLLSLFLLLQLAGFLPLFVVDPEMQMFYIVRKIMDAALGIATVLSLMMFDYRKVKNRHWFILGSAGLILVLFFHLGLFSITINGFTYADFGFFTANSMVVIPLLFIGWAGIFNRYAGRPLLTIGLFCISLILFMPVSRVSDTFIYVAMVLTMYFWSIRRQSKKWSVSMIAALLTMVAGYLLVTWKYSNTYIRDRFMGYLFPDRYESTFGYLPLQIKKYLIEAGWLGQRKQIENFVLPESQTDMVFVTLTYTFGWTFSIAIALFLTAIMVRICWISRKTPDAFGQLLIVGAAALYSVPFVYNIWMVFGLVPLAGISLPFLSYGTVSILINSVIIGLVLSVYRRKDLVFIPNK